MTSSSTDKTDRLVEYGASTNDFIERGYPIRESKRAGTTVPTPTSLVSVPLPASSAESVVAFVPMTDESRRLRNAGVYMRDLGLRGRISVDATHLGTIDGSTVHVAPILGRWAAPHGQAAVTAGLIPAAFHAEVAYKWPSRAALIVVDWNKQIAWPHGMPFASGFKVPHSRASTGLAGVRHRRLDDLIAAAAVGQPFTSVT